MPDRPHLLVVDDDSRLRELLQRYLSENGFRVTTAPDAEAARAKLASLTFDLIVLDVMMPGEDGLALTESLRTTSSVPILLLTARGEPEDRIDGLERGADDYLSKPFEPRELVLRIGTILRRTPPPEAPAAEISFGDYRFDVDRQVLYHGADPVRLTEAEGRLLAVLAQAPGTPMTREQLTKEIGINGSERSVDVQVTRLRRKIEEDPKTPRYLRTVRGKGYTLWPD
ncbi:MAG: response regulator [Alphaproteobacteria bacterium]|nr:response regulator [Alphaproteobacteria bacterium]